MINKNQNVSLLLFKIIYLFWLSWVIIAAHQLSLVVANEGYSPVVLFRLLLAMTSYYEAQALGTGLESSQTKGQMHIPCTGRRILNPWTTRGVFPLLLIH